MTATLLALDGENLEQDGGGEAARDVYYVDSPRQSALADPELPQKGDAHPDEPGLFADAITARPAPDGNSLVTVLYSNDGRFGTPEQQDDGLQDGQFSWSVTFATIEQPIPVIKKVRKRLPAPNGELADPIEVWELSQLSVPEIRAINALTANSEFTLSGGVPSSLPQFTSISAQAGKIHLIGTQRFAFMPKDVDQRTPEKWGLRYEWMQDNGTVVEQFEYDTASAEGSPNQLGIGRWIGTDNIKIPYYNQSGLGANYVRPPLRFIQVTPDPETPTQLPLLSFPYAFNPSDEGGWVTLPGVL